MEKEIMDFIEKETEKAWKIAEKIWKKIEKKTKDKPKSREYYLSYFWQVIPGLIMARVMMLMIIEAHKDKK